MSNMNPNYEPRTLLAAFETGPLSHTFLRDTFFPAREYPPTNMVEFDFRRGRRKMAPFVAPLVGGKVMERMGYETLARPSTLAGQPLTEQLTYWLRIPSFSMRPSAEEKSGCAAPC